MPDAIGIDISHWNAVADYKAAVASGLAFVMLKCTEGTYLADESYAANVAGFRAAGLQRIISYHFLTGENPIDQAAFFYSHLAYGLPMLDFEENPTGATATRAQAAAFCDEIQKRTGALPILYSRKSFLGSGTLPDPLSKCPLFFADYSRGSAQYVPAQWPVWAFRQFNNGAVGDGPYTVPGIVGGIDHDMLNPTLDIDVVWAAAQKALPIPVPALGAKALLSAIPDNLQIGPGADRFRNDCGVACVQDMLAYYGLRFDTVDAMAAHTSLAKSDSGLYPIELVWLAATYGLALEVRNGTVSTDIVAEIDKQHPVILLGYDTFWPGVRPTGDHYVVAIGYDDDNIYINDPNQPQATGMHLAVPRSAIDAGIAHNGDSGACVFVASVPGVATIGGSVNIQHEKDSDANGTYIRATPNRLADGSNIVGSVANSTPLGVDENSLTNGYVRITGGLMIDLSGKSVLAANYWIMLSELAPLPDAATTAIMYVNTLPVAGQPQHLIVHKSPDHNSANYMRDAQGNIVYLEDQTQVLVVTGTGQLQVALDGTTWYQVAAGDKNVPGAFLVGSGGLLQSQPRPTLIVAPNSGVVRPANPQDLVGLHTETRGHWVPGFFKSIYPKRRIKATVLRGTEDDACTVGDLIAIDPNAQLIERWYWDGNSGLPNLPDMRIDQDNTRAGAEFFAAYVAKFNPDRRAYVQAYNEPPYGPGFPSWAIGQIKQAAFMGHRVIVGNFSTQNPDQAFWQLSRTADMIRAIKQYRGILGLHRYVVPDPTGQWNEGPMADLPTILSWLPADCRDVPIWLNEYGVGAGSTMSSEQYVAGVTAGANFLWACGANVQGFSLWCAGDWWPRPNQQGPNSNIAAHQAELATWLNS